MNNLHPKGKDTFDWDQLGRHKFFFEWGIDSPELHDDLRRYWEQELGSGLSGCKTARLEPILKVDYGVLVDFEDCGADKIAKLLFGQEMQALISHGYEVTNAGLYRVGGEDDVGEGLKKGRQSVTKFGFAPMIRAGVIASRVDEDERTSISVENEALGTGRGYARGMGASFEGFLFPLAEYHGEPLSRTYRGKVIHEGSTGSFRVEVINFLAGRILQMRYDGLVEVGGRTLRVTVATFPDIQFDINDYCSDRGIDPINLLIDPALFKTHVGNIPLNSFYLNLSDPADSNGEPLLKVNVQKGRDGDWGDRIKTDSSVFVIDRGSLQADQTGLTVNQLLQAMRNK